MKGIRALYLVLIIAGITACSNRKQPLPENWNQLDRAEFSVQYPNDWIMDATGVNGTTFFLRTPPADSTDRFTENVNLLIQDLQATPMDLEAFVELSEQQIKELMNESRLLESERITVNGKAFHRVRFSYRQGMFRLMTIQYYAVEGYKAFVMTLTCEERTFDRYKETGERIMRSLVLR